MTGNVCLKAVVAMVCLAAFLCNAGCSSNSVNETAGGYSLVSIASNEVDRFLVARDETVIAAYQVELNDEPPEPGYYETGFRFFYHQSGTDPGLPFTGAMPRPGISCAVQFIVVFNNRTDKPYFKIIQQIDGQAAVSQISLKGRVEGNFRFFIRDSIDNISFGQSITLVNLSSSGSNRILEKNCTDHFGSFMLLGRNVEQYSIDFYISIQEQYDHSAE